MTSTDSRGLDTTNIFDPLGRLWERRSTGGLQEQRHYELHPGESYATGSGGTRLLDVTAYVNALGQMRRMTYDGIRRLVQTVDTRGTTNQMAYCDCGSPATVIEAAGTSIARTASYEYDFQGKRWKSTTPEGSMSTNHYDLLGRLVLVQDPFGWSTNRYDNLGRLVQTLNAAVSQMLLSHDVLDRVRIRTDLNGVTITNHYAYDRGGSLTNVSSPGYAGNVARTYTYDALGRMTNMAPMGSRL